MNQEWKAAIAATASGIGIASGRNVAMFYSQMGWTSWLGAAAAAVIFGMLCSGGCFFARRTGSETLADACVLCLGKRFGGLLGLLHAFLAAITGLVMLEEAGRLMALALPVRHALWMGVLFALGIAFLLNMRAGRCFPRFAGAAIAICMLFYMLLSLDPRPAQFYRKFETVASLSGSVSAALLMAMLHGSMWALLSINGVMRQTMHVKSAFNFGVRCGGIMLAVILPMNAAILSGGPKLLSLAYPEAALAARWGKAGYYICILSMEIQVIATLCACVGILIGTNAKHDKIPC